MPCIYGFMSGVAVLSLRLSANGVYQSSNSHRLRPVEPFILLSPVRSIRACRFDLSWRGPDCVALHQEMLAALQTRVLPERERRLPVSPVTARKALLNRDSVASVRSTGYGTIPWAAPLVATAIKAPCFASPGLIEKSSNPYGLNGSLRAVRLTCTLSGPIWTWTSPTLSPRNAGPLPSAGSLYAASIRHWGVKCVLKDGDRRTSARKSLFLNLTGSSPLSMAPTMKP